MSVTACRGPVADVIIGTVSGVDLGNARVSTAKQNLERQLHALAEVGIPPEPTFVDEELWVDHRPVVRADAVESLTAAGIPGAPERVE